MRLRQIALAARELEPATDALCDVLGVEIGFHDPGVEVFGLENAVMPVGETFLEVVAPAREGTTAGRWIARRGGDAGYMVILQTRELAAARARAEAAGARVVWEATLEDAATVHLHPRDVGGAILSLDAMARWEDWRWAGPEWRAHVRQGGAGGLLGAHLEGPEPEALASRWSEVLGVPWKPDAEGRPAIALVEGGTLRFTRGPAEREPGLVAVEVAVSDPAGFAARARVRGALQPDGSALLAGVRFLPVADEAARA